MGKNITVLKFGGAVLNSAEGFRAMLQVLELYKNKKILTVVSAFGKSTRILTDAARQAESGDYEKAVLTASACINLYRKILSEISEKYPKAEAQFVSAVSGLLNLLKGISITGELTARTLDAVVSCGEKFALEIASLFLDANGIGNIPVESSGLIKTDSRFGSAEPNLELSRKLIGEKIPKYFERTDLVITQGFVASDENGEITTMGMESSNLSAALFAESLEAGEFVIYTDVEGVRSCDPKLNSVSKLIPKMNYSEAKFAGLSGLKLIFPAMADILAEGNIECKIASAFAPNGEFTIIGMEKSAGPDALITIENEISEYNSLKSGETHKAEKFTQLNRNNSTVKLKSKKIIALNEESADKLPKIFSNEVNTAGRNLKFSEFTGLTARIVTEEEVRNI